MGRSLKEIETRRKAKIKRDYKHNLEYLVSIARLCGETITISKHGFYYYESHIFRILLRLKKSIARRLVSEGHCKLVNHETGETIE